MALPLVVAQGEFERMGDNNYCRIVITAIDWPDSSSSDGAAGGMTPLRTQADIDAVRAIAEKCRM